jgi:hypothetical protein
MTKPVLPAIPDSKPGANDGLEAWSLFDVKAALDEAIAAAPKAW